MPKDITTSAYEFDELDDKAKEKAREWYREMLNHDCDDWWYSCCYDDFERVAEIIGISFDRRFERGHDGIERDRGPQIHFSGFCSQGDGASFVGSYSCKPDAVAEIRAYAPEDKALHAIVDDLMEMQVKYLFGVKAETTSGGGRYCHEYSVEIRVYDGRTGDDEPDEIEEDDDVAVKGALRSFMKWMYSQLEAANDDRYSDACVDDNITGNEYLFTKEGARHEYA